MREFGDRIVSRDDEFSGAEITESSAEFIGAPVDRIPKVGNNTESLLGLEFRLPILPCRLFFERGENLERVGGSDGRRARFLNAQEPYTSGETKDAKEKEDSPPGNGCGRWHATKVYRVSHKETKESWRKCVRRVARMVSIVPEFPTVR